LFFSQMVFVHPGSSCLPVVRILNLVVESGLLALNQCRGIPVPVTVYDSDLLFFLKHTVL
jgi:hypothetical protein